jgi:F0F1-type ATP synthase membrane subunit b/b'
MTDRAKLLSLRIRAGRRVNDLAQQAQNIATRVKLAKNVSLHEALRSRQKTIETDLRKAKEDLAKRTRELADFDARSAGGANP